MHQNKFLSLLIAGVLFLAVCPQMPAAAAESAGSDFVIENGVLLEYTGNDPVVHVPEGVTEIGFQAFVRTKTVQNINSPELSLKIPYNDVLEEVYLPESLLVIDERAFYSCVSLKKVHFQEGLKKINSHAFSNYCELNYTEYGLTEADMQMHLESAELPDSLDTLGEYAFQGSGLQSVSFGSGLKTIAPYAFAYTDLKTVTLPDNIVYLTWYCFAGSKLESVHLPDNLVKIDESAFMNTCLKSVSFPETLQWIGDKSFMGTGLKEITIPAAVSTLGSYAFANTQLKSVTYEGSIRNMGKNVYMNTPYAMTHTENVGDFEILEGNLVQYTGNDVTVIVPDTVKTISKEAFQGASRLRYLYLPDSVTQINDRAFANCSHLREVHFGNSVTTIGIEAFSNCEKLRRIMLPDSVRSIGNSAFANCISLEDARLNDGLKTVGYSFFHNCPALKTLRIPSSLEKCERSYYLHDLESDRWDSITETVASFYKEYPELITGNHCEIVECSLLGPQCRETVVYGESGSMAPGIAENLHLTWKPLSELPEFDPVPDGPDMTLNISTDTWKFLNAGSVFGSERYMTDEARAYAKQTVNGELADLDAAFDGSCYGMSLTVILAKAGKLKASDLHTGAKNLKELEPDQTVQSVINFYHYMQYAQNLTVTTGSNYDDTLADMLETAENIPRGELPMLLTLNMKSGNHAVVGYGLEKGAWVWNDRKYDRRVLIWDPNSPNELKDDACLYISSITLDYCIPFYGIIYDYNENGLKQGLVGSCSNDLNRLLPAEYPFATQASVKRGDMNCDGQTDVSDAVLLARFLAEDREAVITDQGMKNAETDGEAGLTMSDLTVMLKIIAKIIR